MALADLLTRLERRADTPDTSWELHEVSANPASIQARTLDTPVTPQNFTTPSEVSDVSTGKTQKPDPYPDDRRTCSQCSNLQVQVCSIAYPGGVVSANRGYQPAPDILHRCAGYLPVIR